MHTVSIEKAVDSREAIVCAWAVQLCASKETPERNTKNIKTIPRDWKLNQSEQNTP
jgi:hypothetical protein